MSLESQVSVVTGASTGIGRATALALARAGSRVVVNYRTKHEQAHEVAESIRAEGGEALVSQADVSSEQDVRRLFREACEAFGTVHVLVANAGLQQDAPLAEMSLAQWQRVLDVNLTGQFLAAREAVSIFRQRGRDASGSRALGKIVLMSSVHEVIPWAGRVNYAASKGGVGMLMRSLAQELAPEGIRVNGVGPGAIRTEINRDAWQQPEARDALLRLIPYGRMGEVDDVARAVVWLCSDESDYVTGHLLVVDGGMTLYPAFREGG